jgi:tetratricopeptide (TPR) repeat protein
LLPPQVGYEQTRRHALHALEISPDLAMAHAGLSYVHRTYDWDWGAADTENRLALKASPRDANSNQFAAMLADTLGRPDEAIPYLRTALESDPLNTYARWNLAASLYYAKRYAEAEAEYRTLLATAPDFSWTHSYLAKTLVVMGRATDAVVVAEQEPEELNRLDLLPIALEAAGRKSDADAALQTLIQKYANSEAYFVAMTYAYRNDADNTIRWLERAYAQRDASLAEITGEPLFKNVANDPRYKSFMRKMKLPEQ